MILAEGTKHGLFQSIMMKPPNIAPVYPLRSEADPETLTVELKNNGEPLVIFNTETLDPKSLIYSFNEGRDYLFTLLNRLYVANVDVLILVDPRHLEYVQGTLPSDRPLNGKKFIAVGVSDPFNF